MALDEKIKAEVLDIIKTKENYLYVMVMNSVGLRMADELYEGFVEKVVVLICTGKFNFDETQGYAIKTYLGKICTNYLIDYSRSQEARFRKEKLKREDTDFSKLNVVDRPYSYDKLDIAFKALKLVEGEKGYLFLEDRLLGFQYEEIATKYKVPLGTVKAQLNRIINILESRTKFSKEFQELGEK